ncbi:serine hydrolase domain-containing protein [Massilia endophytica]|uniref:serine hydrolase domain-containing protein n=1 Tax=Massilia endophytica TaxID=2899220 RepID=UPI001E45743C|nr:serine hydrolase domain-containing protein [Massilia endophytica]UGQ46292.1 beta-lactamase family protein [Massilia endophytica]
MADELDSYLKSEMARNHIPGAAVAVLKDGKLVKLAAYGVADLENNVPVSLNSAFQLASTTKLFTSTLLMQLVGEGKIELDAPVSRYIPDTPEGWKNMTVRQLAGHTSGLPRGPVTHDISNAAEAVQAAMKKPLAARPGEVAAYGSDDFSVLTFIIEKVSGKTLQQLYAERFAAQGMETIRFDNAFVEKARIVTTSDIIPNRVTTYQWKQGRQQAYRFHYPTYTYSAGGLFASVKDMAGLLQGISSGKLLAPALQEQMWTPAKLNDGKLAGFAVGWTVSTYRGERLVGHAGGPALADVIYFPARKLGVVVLANQRSMAPVLAHGVANFYLPPSPYLNKPGIADSRPELTQALKPVLNALAQGKAEAASFTGEAKKGLAEINGWLPYELGALPPLSGLLLVEESGNRRVYRAIYGSEHTVRWIVKYDAEGKIEDIETADE